MEGFFLAGGAVDAVELKELLYHRYHTLEMIDSMELEEFLEFVVLAREKESDDRIYAQWCGMLPTLNEYMSFNAFKDKITGKNIDMRPTEVIIAEIEALHGKGQNGT